MVRENTELQLSIFSLLFSNSGNAYDAYQGSLDSNSNTHISENVKEPEKEQC